MNIGPSAPVLGFTTEHARRRRILAPDFSYKATEEQRQFIKPHISKFCDFHLATPQASDKWTALVNVKPFLRWLGTDLANNLYGESLSLLSNPASRDGAMRSGLSVRNVPVSD
jgi:hypothetical protein